MVQGVENEATALPAPGPEDNVLREKRFDVAAAGIYATSDGECRDEMNLNLWQVWTSHSTVLRRNCCCPTCCVRHYFAEAAASAISRSGYAAGS